MQPLVILTGPTAVGKTAVSVQLAKRIDGEIISADALQVYRHMDIGTAKVTPDETDGVKHYLIDVLEPTEEFNAAKFKKMALEALSNIYEKGKVPIITGGTGFYIQALLYDIDFENPKDTAPDSQSDERGADEARKQLREKFNRICEEHGREYLHDMLRQVDEKSAQAIHPNNVQRVVRALEYCYSTNNKFSEYNESQKEKAAAYNYAYFVLNDDRDKLYERIDRRVDKMFEDGLLDEMESLMAMGLTREHQAMQAIGYRELFDYRSGAVSLSDTKELIKQNSRRYAKRQLTWFRRERGVDWINYPDFGNSKEKIIDYMTSVLKERRIV